MPIHVTKWLARRGRRSHPIRRRANQSRPLAASERLEPRAMMAADPQVLWSSYLGNAGNQTIEGAWVAPDETVFMKWSDGPGDKSGLSRFDSQLVQDSLWASSLSKILTGSGNPGSALGTDWTIHPLGIAEIQFGSETNAGITKPAIYIAGQSNQAGWTRNGYDITNNVGQNGAAGYGFNDLNVNGNRYANEPSEIRQDGFIAKLGLDGTLYWSTFIGDNAREWLQSISIASDGVADVVYAAGISRALFSSTSFYNDSDSPGFWEWSSADPWAVGGFDVVPDYKSGTPLSPGNFNNGVVSETERVASQEGFLAKIYDARNSSDQPQNIWSTYFSPVGHVMRDAAGQPTGQTVTYDGYSADFVWVDSQKFVWTVVDGQRLFKMAPDGRLDEIRSFRLLPEITAKVVLGNNAYFLGKDTTGKNVVQKVILEDPNDVNNNWTIPWQIELGDIAPTSIAVDPAGDKVYLGGNTRVGQEVPGLLKNDGTILQPIGTRSGPTDGYLVQLTASTGNPDWMMYIGGDGTENVTAIAARSDGTVWVMGDTDSRPNDSTGPWTPSYWIKGGVSNADVSFYEAGAGSRDGFVVSVKTDDRVAAIAVAGSGNAAITDGDNSPSRTDGTDLGRTAIGSPITQAFTIRNTGNGRLTLTNPSLPNGFTFATPLPTALEAGQSATFSIRLDADANLPLGVKTGSVSFTTNDPSKPVFDFQIRGELLDQVLPELSVADIAVVEGNSGTTAAVFTVSATPAIASGRTATVSYRIVSGSATAGRDYRVANGGVGTLTFAPGESTKTVSVDVIGDRVRESNETFRIVLSGATGATLGLSEATATITDDDTTTTPVGQRPTITFENVRVSEGTGKASVVVRLSAASQSAVSVQYVTANGTARSVEDYTRVTGKLQFAAGETSKTIEIPLVNDSGAEADETFTLRFSSPVNATLPVAAATITILNDDAATALPVPTVSSPSITEGNTGRPSMRFTITLAAAATQTITYGVRTGAVGDSAVAGTDYLALREGATVTFRKGQRTATVVVSVIANRTVDGDRRLTLQLTNSGGSVIASGVGTIRDDDVSTALALAFATSGSPASSTTSRLRLPTIR